MEKKVETEKQATPDTLWKLVIHDFFKEVLEIFMPELLKDIIIEKTEFLEQELLSITGKQKKGIVDVLTKIYLKNGKDEFLLFHAEVQSSKEDNFSERMYSYYIRIWDKHRKPIVSLAILVGRAKNMVVDNKYEISTHGTRQLFEYNIVDISKFDYDDCINSKNPVRVAISILVKKKGLQKWKKTAKAIIKLKHLGLVQNKINLLIAFVDRLSDLSPVSLEKFDEYIIKNEKEVSMIMTSWEERGIKKGMEKGIEKGMEKGMEQGIEKGMEQGLEKGRLEVAKNLLKDRVDIRLISRATKIPLSKIKLLQKQKV